MRPSVHLTCVVGLSILLATHHASYAQTSAPNQAARDARAQQEREWQQTLEGVTRANEEAQREWEKNFPITQSQRNAFDKKMDDFAKQNQPPGTTIHTVMRADESGLPTSGTVMFVQEGVVAYQAEFDAAGNTTGVVQTQDGRAVQNTDAHLPRDVHVSVGFDFATGADGLPHIRYAFYSGPDGIRGSIDFNQDGNAYRGEFFGPGGRRSGGFYDASLEPKEAPPSAMALPPPARVVTQPCPACRAAADAYNAIAERMNAMRQEMVPVVNENAATHPGLRRQALEQQFAGTSARYAALATELQAALARLQQCVAACIQPTTTVTAATTTAAGPSAPAAIALQPNPAQTGVAPAQNNNGFAACKKMVPGRPNRGVTAAQAIDYLKGMAAGNTGKGPSAQPILKPTDVAIGDFNGDGCDDVAEIDRGATPAHLQLLVGTGTGTFSFFKDTPLTSAPLSIAATDVDHDGLYDIAIGVTGAMNGIEMFTGAFLTGTAPGPTFTATPIVPRKLGGLSAETGRVLNWTAIFDEVNDFETALVAAGPNASGQTSLLSFPAVRPALTNGAVPQMVMRTTPLAFEPTVLTIGPMGQFAAGQAPRLGTFVGGPSGLDVYMFDNNAATTFHINDTPNPRKVAIGVDHLSNARNEPFVVTLGFGVLVVNNADTVNVQGFVVNAHANAFDVSVFGFDPHPQPIGADALGGSGSANLAVAVAPTPEHPGGSVSTFVLPHVLEKSGTILNPQFTFDTNLFVTYTPGLSNPPSAFAVGGASVTTNLIAAGPNGLAGGTIGPNGLTPFPVEVRTDDWSAIDQYVNRNAFLRLAGSTKIPASALTAQQWAAGFGLTVPQANLIAATAPALNKSLLALGHLELAHESFPWVVPEHLTVTNIADAIAEPGVPLAAEVNNSFLVLANDVTQSVKSVPALNDEASLTNYAIVLDSLGSLQQNWTNARGGSFGPLTTALYTAHVALPKVSVPADTLVATLRRNEIRHQQDPAGTAAAPSYDTTMRIALAAALGHPVAPGAAGLTAAHQEFDAAFGPPPIMANATGVTLPSTLGPVTIQRGTPGPDIEIPNYRTAVDVLDFGRIPALPGTDEPRLDRVLIDGSGGLLIGHPDGNVSFGAPDGTWTLSPDPNAPIVYSGFNGLQWTIGGPAPITPNAPAAPAVTVGNQAVGGSNSILNSTFASVQGGFHVLPPGSVPRSDYANQFLGAEMVFQKRYSNRWSFDANLAMNDWADHFSAPGTMTLNTDTDDFSSVTFYDPAFAQQPQEVEVSAGGNDALQMTGGIGINIVTKRGSNDFHGSGTFFVNDSPPPANFNGDELSTGLQVNQVLDFGGEVGGPVIKDRLWFWGSGNRNRITDPNAPNSQLINDGGTLTGQLADGSEANFFFHVGDEMKDGPTDGSPTTSGGGGGGIFTGGDGVNLANSTVSGNTANCCTPGIQVMTLDFGDPATVNPTGAGKDDDASSRFSLPRLARGVLAMLQSAARGGRPSAATAAMRFANQPIGLPPAFDIDQNRGATPQAAAPASPIQTVIQSNGNSQGEAFDMKIINRGLAPLKVFGSGVVVEPIKKELQAKMQQELMKLAGNNVFTRKVEAYCLQYGLAPPTPGMLYQIAGQDLQQKFKPAGLIMKASRQIADAGGMHPDSNPKSYLDSIKQYAIWTKFEGWDQKKFGEVLLDKTKKAAAAAKANWTGQMESALMSAVPGRWRDVQSILSAAQELSSRSPQ